MAANQPPHPETPQNHKQNQPSNKMYILFHSAMAVGRSMLEDMSAYYMCNCVNQWKVFSVSPFLHCKFVTLWHQKDLVDHGVLAGRWIPLAPL